MSYKQDRACEIRPGRKVLPVGEMIVWRHFMIDGTYVDRDGQVISDAPAIAGGPQVVRWVVPVEPLNTDLYAIVAVAKATRYTLAHGSRLDEACRGNQYATRGMLFASNYMGSPTGAMAARAARAAYEVRTSR
jgi:hypothetical protein